MWVRWLAALIVGLMPGLASAQTGARPIAVELFTSEGCSSCPPADALMAELARTRPDLLVLTFHVTYWNNLGWTDPFSFEGATERQRRYVGLGVSPQVYTPALVVDGRLDAIGSNRGAVSAALKNAEADRPMAASVDVARQGDTLTVTLGAGSGRGTLLLVGYDRQHVTHVGFGENGGRTLVEANIVRSLSVAGAWTGKAIRLQAPVPPGEAVAVLLQADDGHIIGAGRLAALGT